MIFMPPAPCFKHACEEMKALANEVLRSKLCVCQVIFTSDFIH